ncbi:MAG: hypothetical protein MRY21_02690 [Simkaniaceae bacterium]|nr:hypothetical protein [Simkaniaceae bacterium]
MEALIDKSSLEWFISYSDEVDTIAAKASNKIFTHIFSNLAKAHHENFRDFFYEAKNNTSPQFYKNVLIVTKEVLFNHIPRYASPELESYASCARRCKQMFASIASKKFFKIEHEVIEKWSFEIAVGYYASI